MIATPEKKMKTKAERKQAALDAYKKTRDAAWAVVRAAWAADAAENKKQSDIIREIWPNVECEKESGK